jgi:hypothetical protein
MKHRTETALAFVVTAPFVAFMIWALSLNF